MIACGEKGCLCEHQAAWSTCCVERDHRIGKLEQQLQGFEQDYDNTKHENLAMRQLLTEIGVCVSHGDFSVPQHILTELAWQGFIG